MDWQRFSIDPAGLKHDRLLTDWRWLVPSDLRPFSLTLFGDWFFEDKSGSVFFLDTVCGELRSIAPTRAAFLIARELPENSDQWYMTELAQLCLNRGLRTAAGKCLGFKILPILGGKLDVENIEVCDLMVYLSITGQIHRQTKSLPPGTLITGITVDGAEP